MISARLFIVSATLVFWGGAVSADSIHSRKVLLIGIEKEKANSKGESDIEEALRFVRGKCPHEKYVRISIQPASNYPKGPRFAESVRLRIVKETGILDFQVFTMPGWALRDYLKKNDLVDLPSAVKNTIAVEVFC